MEQVQQGVWNPKPGIEDIIDGLGGLDHLDEAQLKELYEVKKEILYAQNQMPVLFYKPYESRIRKGYKPQEAFHKSMKKIRLFCGGNRSGKSEAGIIEGIWTALGIHPFYKVRVPNHGWIVSLDFPMSRDVAEEKLNKWLPSKLIRKWDTKQRVIYLTNGSTIGLRSCDQDVETFGGSNKDWIHFDEEPRGERGFAIYRECLMRTADTQGRIWFTLTPVRGISWTYDQLFERKDTDDKIEVFEVESYENPYVPLKELKDIENLYDDPEERLMRLKGKYIQFSGLVFKNFDAEIHVIDAIPIPKNVLKFRSIDHGLRNPTACLFGYINEKNELYIYDEYYETDKTIKENADAIKLLTGGDKIAWTTIDPSTDNRNPKDRVSIRQEYASYGIYTLSQRTDKVQGIERVRSMLKVDQDTKRPKLFFYRNCYNTIREMQRYRFKDYRGNEMMNKVEDPAKVNDHAMDALRYMVMSNPRYDVYLEENMIPEAKVWYK